MNEFSIDDLLFSPEVENAALGAKEGHVLQFGLQKCLIVIACTYIASAVLHREITDGLSAQFISAFSNPTPGKLFEFLLWLVGNHKGQHLRRLTDYLQRNEFAPSGWFHQLVLLRNRWMHPTGESPEHVLTLTARHLEVPPVLSELGELSIDLQGTVFWRTDDSIVPLSPFVFSMNDQIETIQEFSAPGTFVLTRENSIIQSRLREVWQTIRVLDQALERPTPDDIHMKAAPLTPVCSGEAPWWLMDVFQRNALARLVTPEIAIGVVAHLKDVHPKASIIEIDLDGDLDPCTSIAHLLGLGHAPTPQELISFADSERRILVVIRTGRIDSKAFGKLLDWAADLKEIAKENHLRILIERKREELQQDQRRLWDHLSSFLEVGVLEKPPTNHGDDLSDFLWDEFKRKRFLGLFDLLM